jgi:hypothetical protein
MVRATGSEVVFISWCLTPALSLIGRPRRTLDCRHGGTASAATPGARRREYSFSGPLRRSPFLPIVRGAVYLPEFGFTNSLKSVAPALCPSFGYDDLDGVADGLAASSAFHQIASGEITAPDELANLRIQLLAYCERDTLAMVEAHQALMQLKIPELA